MAQLLPHPDQIAQLLIGLHKTSNGIPSALLYDKTGSDVYEEITQLDKYYLFATEFELLRKNAQLIAATVPAGTLVVELGCGTATKTAVLLNALQNLHGSCRYAGIDVSGTALSEGRDALLRNVEGLNSEDVLLVQDEYLEGLRQVRQMFPYDKLCILWLGSSVGSFSQEDAIAHFNEMLEVVGSRCQIFLCTDLWKDEKMLYAAYCDRKGVIERFIKNGMKNALSLLGHVVTRDEVESWIYQVDVNKHLKRVEMRIVFPKGLEIDKHQVYISCGESVLVTFSRKFTLQNIQELAAETGLHIHEAWRNRIYSCQMLLPYLEAFLRCWAGTDALFSDITDWNARPIDLRHPLCFYYGHVNAFAKLELLPSLSSSKFDNIFSRGTDRIFLDPTNCRLHPEPPSEWPSMDCIYNYVKNTRICVTEAITKRQISMKLLHLTLEYERMHQETVAYMLAQQRKLTWESNPVWTGDKTSHLKWTPPVSNFPSITVPAGEVLLGVDEKEMGVFVWDNEQPSWRTSVPSSFLLSPMPTTIGQFMAFVLEGGYERDDLWDAEDFALFKKNGFKWPSTWSMNGKDCYVHGPFSTKHWTEVQNEPVYVSLSEAEAYCRWVGGCRVMTEEEYHKALDMSEEDRESGTELAIVQLRDDGWEWTSSVFRPFPGFQGMKEYKKYSADFFDERHYVLKGSSPTTHRSMRRDSYRKFYQRQYRYAFAKFRCCR